VRYLACGALAVLASLPVLVAPASSQAATKRVFVSQYQLSFDPLDGCKLEPGGGMLASHIVFYRLDRSACGAPGSKSWMQIYAAFNAVFVPDALTDMKSQWAGAAWGMGEWRGAIDGLRTSMNRRESRDGSIDIELEAMAQKWQDGFGEEGRTPREIYVVRLHTSKVHFTEDMKIFRKFVCSIHVVDDGKGSTLCARPVS
jgi:hypothetical protein